MVWGQAANLLANRIPDDGLPAALTQHLQSFFNFRNALVRQEAAIIRFCDNVFLQRVEEPFFIWSIHLAASSFWKQSV